MITKTLWGFTEGTQLRNILFWPLLLHYRLMIHCASVEIFHKMTLVDETKVINDKFWVNQDQYNLGREAAQIFVLSSDKLRKYE